jgi:FAD/FMN-containing dehydrogenase
LPPFPASLEYSTVGGAIANNASGEKTVKYGNTRDFVRSMRVVLANGEVIETKRLTKRELNKKLGLATFEGEIYRNLDTLLDENKALATQPGPNVTKNAAGYALQDVKRKDGSFDLTPLFVGSQGTLGIVTEATLATVPHNPNTTLIAAFVDDLVVAEEIVTDLRKLSEGPSAIEVVDSNLLDFVQRTNPNQLRGILNPPFPQLVLLIEFDNISERSQKRMVKKATKILSKLQVSYQVETDPHKRDELWKIRHSAAAVMSHSEGTARALPIIEDGIVPMDRFKEYVEGVYALFKRHNLQAAVWGHAGDANLHIQPFLDLAQLGDRQMIFKLLDEYYALVISLGGSTSGEHNDGRLRGAYLEKLYGPDVYDLYRKVKQIFDPYNTLNSGVKINVALEDLKPLLRQEYSLDHLYQHMPRT